MSSDSIVIFDGATTVTTNGNVFNDVQIGSGIAGALVITADDFNVDGNLTVNNGGATTFDISNDNIVASAGFDLGGLDTFTTASSTVTFDGTTTQTVASNSNTYNTISVTNASVSGVSFTEAFTAANLINQIPGTQMRFQQSSTFTITNAMTLTGALNNEIVIDSVNGSSQFTFDVSSEQTVNFVRVSNSAASTNDINAIDSIDDGGNDTGTGTPQWVFVTPDGTVFTVEGTTSFEVPKNVTSITVKAWGGGGGGGAGGSLGVGGNGGGGGYSLATIAVTPSETLTIHVGGGGSGGSVVGTAGGGGGGGGRSAILRGGTSLVIAAGGGGGGGGDDSSATAGGAGAPGGGTSGSAGTASGVAGGGGGGTAVSGGAAGTGGVTSGLAGALNIGGDGASNSSTGDGAAGGASNGGTAGVGVSGFGAGGGGGSGLYGGGGGSSAGNADAGGGGGGSGSALLTGTSTATTAGTGTLAGNDSDVDYAGNAGQGGLGGALLTNGSDGLKGRIVFNYVSGSVDITGTSDLPDGSLIKVAVDDELCVGFQGTVTSGNWSVADVPILTGNVVTVWAEDGDDDIDVADEATSVTKYDGTGDITGMRVDRHTLTIGSNDNPTLTLTELGLYDNIQDEDIMHMVTAGTMLIVDADEVYSDELLRVLNGSSLIISDGEEIDSQNVDVEGTLTTTGTISVQGDWDSTGGGMTELPGTVLFTGTYTQMVTGGTLAFNNFVIDKTGTIGSQDVVVVGTLDINGTFLLENGIFDLSTNNAPMFVEGNFLLMSGTFLPGSATITFDGDKIFRDNIMTNVGTIAVDPTTTLTTNFMCTDLTILANDTLVTDGYNIVCSDDITISGTLDASPGPGGNTTVSLKGDWDMTGGIFTNTDSTVAFSGTMDQTITSGGLSFDNLAIVNTGVSPDNDVLLADALTVEGTLMLVAGDLDVTASNYPVSVGGNWRNGGGVFIPQSGTVTFSGDGNTHWIMGSNDFNDFVKRDVTDDSTNSRIIFEAGSTQTIAGSFILDGLDDNDRILIRSDDPMVTRFNLDFTGGNQISDYLAVQDSEALSNDIRAFSSSNQGNNDEEQTSNRWIFLLDMDSDPCGCLEFTTLNLPFLGGGLFTPGEFQNQYGD